MRGEPSFEWFDLSAESRKLGEIDLDDGRILVLDPGEATGHDGSDQARKAAARKKLGNAERMIIIKNNA